MVTGDTIKVRTRLKGTRLTVQALFRHPMYVGGRREDGSWRPPHYILHVQCKLGDRVVLEAHWGAGIAHNPYLSFVVDDVRAGDYLTLSWRDNRDAQDCLEFTA